MYKHNEEKQTTEGGGLDSFERIYLYLSSSQFQYTYK